MGLCFVWACSMVRLRWARQMSLRIWQRKFPGMCHPDRAPVVPCESSHLTQHRPSTNLPKTILIQYIIGFTTAFIYAIALFYGLTDLDAVLASTDTYLFPLTEIYRQATTSSGGAFGLLMVVFFLVWSPSSAASSLRAEPFGHWHEITLRPSAKHSAKSIPATAIPATQLSSATPLPPRSGASTWGPRWRFPPSWALSSYYPRSAI